MEILKWAEWCVEVGDGLPFQIELLNSVLTFDNPFRAKKKKYKIKKLNKQIIFHFTLSHR